MTDTTVADPGGAPPNETVINPNQTTVPTPVGSARKTCRNIGGSNTVRSRGRPSSALSGRR